MAELKRIPAHDQLLAIAWLRWRIFVNTLFGSRRTSTSGLVTRLIAAALLRMIVLLFLAPLFLGIIAGTGLLAWFLADRGKWEGLIPLLSGVAIGWQVVSLNGTIAAANAPSFNPLDLLRFPMPFGRYLFLRIVVGLSTPTNVTGCLALLAAAIGIGVARHSLALPGVFVLAVYAAMNVFLTRMVAAWLERWLAIRRIREICNLVVVLFFGGIQFLNYQSATSQSRQSHSGWLIEFFSKSAPVWHWLPPGLAVDSILWRGSWAATLARFTGLLAYAALFLALLALRLHKQFLGEYLSADSGLQKKNRDRPLRPKRHRFAFQSVAPARVDSAANPHSPRVLAACLRREWLNLRGGGTQFLAMLTPVLFVFILGGRLFGAHRAYFLPAAISYVTFGLLAGFYNIFGADGPGVQIYLLAPVRLTDVILAKNIVQTALLLIQIAIVWLVVFAVAGPTIPLSSQMSAAVWIVFVIATNLALGTLRSIQAPRKFVPGQTPRVNRAASANRGTALLVLGLYFASLLLYVPVTYVSNRNGQPWLAALILAPLACGAICAYVLLLRNAERIVLRYRDTLGQELCRV